jgi:hypothetical protein
MKQLSQQCVTRHQLLGQMIEVRGAHHSKILGTKGLIWIELNELVRVDRVTLYVLHALSPFGHGAYSPGGSSSVTSWDAQVRNAFTEVFG